TGPSWCSASSRYEGLSSTRSWSRIPRGSWPTLRPGSTTSTWPSPGPRSASASSTKETCPGCCPGCAPGDMRLLVFLHGIVLMHAGGVGVSRGERVAQVRAKHPTVGEYAAYVPVGDAVAKLRRWQDAGAVVD